MQNKGAPVIQVGAKLASSVGREVVMSVQGCSAQGGPSSACIAALCLASDQMISCSC